MNALLVALLVGWFQLPFNYNDRPQVVRALDNQTIFVTQDKLSMYVIRKTTNDGVTWTGLTLPQMNQNAFGFCFATRDTFYAGGDLSNIWRSVDGGTTWTNLFHRTSGVQMYHISFPRGGTVGYIGASVSSTYSIYKTTDAGATWVTQTPGPHAFWLGVAFWNDQLGYISSNTGSVYKTTNGGATWVLKIQPIADMLREIILPRDSLVSWVVGDRDSGFVWKTVDGWNTFINQKVGSGPETQNFYSISFPPGNVTTGYVAGVKSPAFYPAGVIYKTTNGGTSWALQLSRDSVTFKSVHFPVNDLIGYAAGSFPQSHSPGGVVYKTTNGGSSWVEQEPGQEPVERRSSFSVSPNPARRSQEITLRGAGAVSDLYDVSGRLVRRIKGPRFNSNSLDAGVYVLRSGDDTKKLIILK